MEAITIRLEAITIRLEAIASRLSVELQDGEMESEKQIVEGIKAHSHGTTTS